MLIHSTQTSPLNADPGDLAAIHSTVEHYRLQLVGHPLGTVFTDGRAPLGLLQEFASLQYIDSVLWVPMLALMKDRVKNQRLVRALKENLLCEAGAYATSHITLCRRFIESLGLSAYFGDFNVYTRLATQPIEIMNSVSGLSEAQIAGWILVSETIVPSLFAMAMPGFESIEGVDLQYLREHIAIDSDEHAQWMRESVEELLVSGTSATDILEGIHLGGRAAINVPDALYAKYVRRAYR